MEDDTRKSKPLTTIHAADEGDRKMPRDRVLNAFSHGRTRGINVVAKKPVGADGVSAADAGTTIPLPHSLSAIATARDMGARLLARARKEAEDRISTFVNDPASRFQGVGGTTAALSKDCTRASLLAHEQYRIVVRGCGQVPVKLPKRKRVIVEMVAMDGRSRLVCRGITCDGEMVLPKRTVQVRLELIDLTASVEVTVGSRPNGTRKKYGPKRWIIRRTERPIEGRFRRPKPRT